MTCKTCGKEKAVTTRDGVCFECEAKEEIYSVEDADHEGIIVASCPHCEKGITMRILRR